MTCRVHAFEGRASPGISIADNEAGWESALARLAALVEQRSGGV